MNNIINETQNEEITKEQKGLLAWIKNIEKN